MTQYGQTGLSFQEQALTLYELALGVERPPQTLPVSPATLLSLVTSVIDLLVEQQISATLWSKLPSGEIWQAEIQRYYKEVRVPDAIYTYNLYTENPDGNGVTSSELSRNQFQTSSDSRLVSVQLAPTSQLRREYFLLVLSPQFCSLILAHRPRIKRQTGANEKTDQKKTQQLLAICSLEGRVIQRVLDGIKNAIEQSAGSASTASVAPIGGKRSVTPESGANYTC